MAKNFSQLPEDVQKSYIQLRDAIIPVLKKHPKNLSLNKKEISSVIILSQLGNVTSVKNIFNKINRNYRKYNLFAEYMKDKFELVDGFNWGGGKNSYGIRLKNSTEYVVVLPSKEFAKKKEQEIKASVKANTTDVASKNYYTRSDPTTPRHQASTTTDPYNFESMQSQLKKSENSQLNQMLYKEQAHSSHSKCVSSSPGITTDLKSGNLLEYLSPEIQMIYKKIALEIKKLFLSEITKSSIALDMLSTFQLGFTFIGQQEVIAELIKQLPNKYSKLMVIIKCFPEFVIEDFVAKGGRIVENSAIRWLNADSLNKKSIEQQRKINLKKKNENLKSTSSTQENLQMYKDAKESEPKSKKTGKTSEMGGNVETYNTNHKMLLTESIIPFEQYPPDIKLTITQIRDVILRELDLCPNPEYGLKICEQGQNFEVKELMNKLSLKYRKLKNILFAFPNDFIIVHDKDLIVRRRHLKSKT